MQDQPQPIINIVGAHMLEDELRQYVNDLTTAVEQALPVNYVNIEDEDGARLTDMYEIEEDAVPAVLIINDDESIYKAWYGQDLPATDMVAYEVRELTGAE